MNVRNSLNSMLPARARVGYLAFLLLVLVACAGPPSAPAPPVTSTPAPTQVVATLPARQPLPPTWTPTFTFTPVPPTQTPLPTRPPTITPTRSAAERCAAFALLGSPRDGLLTTRARTGRVTFSWSYTLPDGAVQLVVTHAASGQGRELTAPGVIVAAIPLDALFGPGVYRWSVAPLDDTQMPLSDCAQTGEFRIVQRTREARTDSAGPQPFQPDPLPADERP